MVIKRILQVRLLRKLIKRLLKSRMVNLLVLTMASLELLLRLHLKQQHLL